jgi:hypothetical protein
MIKLTPPNLFNDQSYLNLEPSVFLAGSIEMGACPNWQITVESRLEFSNLCAATFNPRRVDWDSSWKQDISDPKFNEQVNWELDHIEYADIVFFYFDPETKSPISLMELGYCLGMGHDANRLVVVCPQGFWRRGNVQIMCDRSGISLFDSLNDGVNALEKLLTKTK